MYLLLLLLLLGQERLCILDFALPHFHMHFYHYKQSLDFLAITLHYPPLGK